MNKYSEQIDLDLLNGSIETISGVQNLINSVDLTESFNELENYFRKINFEHSYCINYKKPLEIIYGNLNDIKNKINKLSEVLSVIKNSYSDILEIESNPSSIKNILKNAKTNANESITKIEPQNNKQSIQEKPYSTVPIGIAIGATGIAGSVGAVVVNEKYGPAIKEKKVEELYEIVDEEPVIETNKYSKEKEYKVPPYHASRVIRESDKYYGNSDKKIELEDYDDSSIDEFDE